VKQSNSSSPSIPENFSRKKFFIRSLRLMRAMGVGVLFFPNRLGARNKTSAKKKKRFAMVIDAAKCTGCHACAVACKTENDGHLGVWRCDVKEYVSEIKGKVKLDFMPLQCNHCENPSCIEVCPVTKDKFGHRATYQRKDGIVLVDNQRCISCGKCVSACPYDARFMDPITNKANKCTLCAHRLDRGLVPACVNTCPSQVRTIWDLNDPKLKKIQKSAKLLMPEHGTRPAVYYLGIEPNDSYQDGVGTKDRWAQEM